jgi:hypothetical protein
MGPLDSLIGRISTRQFDIIPNPVIVLLVSSDEAPIRVFYEFQQQFGFLVLVHPFLLAAQDRKDEWIVSMVSD